MVQTLNLQENNNKINVLYDSTVFVTQLNLGKAKQVQLTGT